jgi:serine/threonine-protein kinase
MASANWERIEQIFFAALERAPEERQSFLASACRDDDGLRAEVAAMLAAHEGNRRLSPENWADDADSGSAIGMRVGDYRIERLLGRGGMGEVYLASRADETYQHRAAVKIMRPGLRAAELAERFRLERQILAQLQHPHIATLLDGGVTGDGRPYLVMEYVDGVPITDYCDARSLVTRERLLLFRTVCAAVHTAHVRLVVHRDLKPANILVTERGEVKLLDFGIAKLLDPTSPASATRPLERVMTPEHAAPEQVRGEPVTTATDVYALGVLLYLLLTGQRPLPVKSTTSTSDIERVICEVEPLPPSTVAHRDRRALRGDLDTITLTALRKEPARRYQSAQELDEDIGRYLAGLPVHAQRDTLRYRARKFVGRHRVGVAVGAMFAAVVLFFLGVTIKQAGRVRAERDRAVAEEARAEKVVSVLVNLFEQSNPYVVPGGDTLRVGDFVAQSEKVVSKMGDQPDVQARMWEVVSAIHLARGDVPKARDFLHRAEAIYQRDDAHPIDDARVFHSLAQLKSLQDGAESADSLLRVSLGRQRALLGDSHPDVAVAMMDLAAAVMSTHPDEAGELLDGALAICRQHPSDSDVGLAASYNALGLFHRSQHKLTKALADFERSLDILEKALPPDHPNTMTVAHNVAAMHAALGNYKRSEEVVREVIAAKRRILGNESVDLANSIEALAGTLIDEGRYDEARELYTEALHIYENKLGPDHGNVASTNRNLGVTMALRGRPAEGVPYLDRALEIEARMRTPRGSWAPFLDMQRLFVAYAAGQTQGSVAAARLCVAEIDSLSKRPDDSYRAVARIMLANMLLDQSEVRDAEAFSRDAVNVYATYPSDNPRLALARCMLAAVLVAEGRFDEGRQLLSENYATIRSWGALYPLQRAAIEDAMRKVGLPTS